MTVLGEASPRPLKAKCPKQGKGHQARQGAYCMTVGEKTLPNGTACLPAKSNLRRPQVFNP